MTQHFEQRHPGAKVCYTIHPRKEGQSSSSPSLLYQPRKYSRHPSPRKTTEYEARKPSSEAGKTAKNNKSVTPGDISPLRSPSLSISLHGSPPLVNLFGLDEEPTFEPPRKVVRSSVSNPHPAAPSAITNPAVSVPVSARSIPVSSEMAEIPLSFPVTSVSLSESATNPSMSPTSAFMASLGADFPIISPLKDSVATVDLPTLPEPVPAAGSVSSDVSPTPAAIPFPSSSAYILHRCEQSSPEEVSSGLANDPRLYFAGAPSSVRNDFVACLMRRANMEAKRCSNRTVSWVPSGLCAISKVEELIFPDGRVYRLKSILVPDPEYTLTQEASTQTFSLEGTLQTPTMKDASTQVSTKQTFTLE